MKHYSLSCSEVSLEPGDGKSASEKTNPASPHLFSGLPGTSVLWGRDWARV